MHLASLSPCTVADSKRLGDHLIEAGLINAHQLQVAIHDQNATGLRLGEVVVARGWVKEEIIEDLANRLTEATLKSVRSIKHKPTFSARAAVCRAA